MSRVLLATHNEGKLVELRRILDPIAGSLEVVGLDDVGVVDEPVETEPTFAGNALLKARAAVASTGLPALADDSGLCVDALNGMPGVLSARWSGRAKDDTANIDLLLAQLRDVPASRRGAEFRCAVAFVLPDGTEKVEEGVMHGRLLHEVRGSGGFGYDPLFVADGWELTTAELTAEDKDAISHRGRALRAMAPSVVAALT
ncbi:MAG TPA: RdgB/HAM1 family non-canonical purine NTP pyrophosphatase [Nocardioidaceae bacterium]|nr:RdgB/HAM1 family non-canonical purine NTP pyrophosphatase [Nocardioidaceae bacterium]